MKKATSLQIIAINDLLKEHLEKNGEYVNYKPGWNDVKIAAAVSDEITRSSVERLRHQLYGNLKKAPIPKGRYALQERLETLESQMATVMKVLKDLGASV